MSHIVVLSGGMDSATLLYQVRREHRGELLAAVSFDYGQRHKKEIACARDLAMHVGAVFRMVPMGVLHGSALVDKKVDVPEGRYDDVSMKATVVQGRNLAFTSIAVGMSEPGDHLYLGVHAGDHAIYPDCREEFWWHLTKAIHDAYEVHVHTPFIGVGKADIVALGSDLGVPYGLTWSCYKGGDRHCGRCGTCVERAEAFALAGVVDPTDYEDKTYWREQVGLTR